MQWRTPAEIHTLANLIVMSQWDLSRAAALSHLCSLKASALLKVTQLQLEGADLRRRWCSVEHGWLRPADKGSPKDNAPLP